MQAGKLWLAGCFQPRTTRVPAILLCKAFFFVFQVAIKQPKPKVIADKDWQR